MGKAAKRKPKKVVAKLVIKRAVKKSKPKSKPREKTVDKDKDKDKDTTKPADKAPVAKEPLAGGIQGAQPGVNSALPPEAYMTEQEKAGQQAPVADEPAKKKETK